MDNGGRAISGETFEDGAKAKPWREAEPGEVWQVDYVDDLYARSGFTHKSGLHEVYDANGGQRYFSRLVEDRSGGNLSVGNELIKSAKLVAVPSDHGAILVE